MENLTGVVVIGFLIHWVGELIHSMSEEVIATWLDW
jgi:hypothetical protein